MDGGSLHAATGSSDSEWADPPTHEVTLRNQIVWYLLLSRWYSPTISHLTSCPLLPAALFQM